MLGKIVIFKTLAISKIIFVSYLTTVPSDVIHPYDYQDGGLKDIDIESKFKALHMSWLTRFHSDNTHPLMHIPKTLFFNTFSVDSIFPPNLSIDNISLRKLPIFYQEMVKSWIAISQSHPNSISLILSQSLWYNSFIKIDSKPLSPSFLCLKQPLKIFSIPTVHF